MRDTEIVVGTVGGLVVLAILGFALTSDRKENPVRNRPRLKASSGTLADIKRYPEAQILDPHEKEADWYLTKRKLSSFPGVTQEIDEWIEWNLGEIGDEDEDEDEFDHERSSEQERVDQVAQAMADPVSFTGAHPIMISSQGIVDGFHRAAALRQMDWFDTPVWVLYAPEL